MISNNFSSLEMIEKEENLSLEILKSLRPVAQLTEEQLIDRPKDNYYNLGRWMENNFSHYLKDTKNLSRYVHNSIIINGQFVKFCQEKNIKITCLHKDTIISWKSNSGYEKFFMQGVFLISSNNLEFIHAALFHKGSQNDDEVSFFALVSEKNYNQYISLRTSFEDWCSERDRENCLIRVVGAEDISYSKDNSWENLILPEEDKKEIKSFVENFLSSKDFYQENKIPWKTGAILFGPPGCGKTSIIKTIISNYNFKPVTIPPSADDVAVREAFAYAEEQSPSLLYFEDLDSLLERNIDLSNFLNLMDGISSKNGIMVLATANEIKQLKPSITDRPSRFDRKFEICLPDQKMSYIYLSRWFGKMVSVTKLKSLAKLSVENNFSYAYLKELYISSMFEALSKKKKVPTEKDIDNAVNRLMKEKNLIKRKSINTEKYLD
jgi:hypothetical protein